MVRKWYLAAVLVAVLFAVLLGGCGSRTAAVDLPQTSLLIGRGRVALVRAEYARVHEQPDITSPVIGHARQGDIIALGERTADSQWIVAEDAIVRGWVHSSDLELYDSRAQAQNAREMDR